MYSINVSSRFDEVTIEEMDKHSGYICCHTEQAEFLQAAFMVLARMCRQRCIPKWQVGHLPNFREVLDWVGLWNHQNDYHGDWEQGILSASVDDIIDTDGVYRPRIEITYRDWCNRTIKFYFMENFTRLAWVDGTFFLPRIWEEFDELLHLVTAWQAWEEAD